MEYHSKSTSRRKTPIHTTTLVQAPTVSTPHPHTPPPHHHLYNTTHTTTHATTPTLLWADLIMPHSTLATQMPPSFYSHVSCLPHLQLIINNPKRLILMSMSIKIAFLWSLMRIILINIWFLLYLMH
ncbi:hypothetical protein Leryth_026466 [Lithospermum erythrorhizon]|nr:hypothetical protein Leryth_026466 [Lithospermum erythrorhizon]